MPNSNNEEKPFENQTQSTSPSPTSSSQNESCGLQDMTEKQPQSLTLKRRYNKDARQKLKDYFSSESQIDLTIDHALPYILCDDDIAKKLGVSRGAVRKYRKKHRIPDRDVRVDNALRTLFSATRRSFCSVKNFQQLLAEQKLNESKLTEIVVITTILVTAAVTSLFFYLFLM
jgi:hypothetical protein